MAGEDSVRCGLDLLALAEVDATVHHFALDVLERQVRLFWFDLEDSQRSYLVKTTKELFYSVR